MTEQGSPALESLSIAVIGLGYVGLPLALLFVSKGFEVYGIDVDRRKIKSLEDRKSYLPDLSDEMIDHYMGSGRFHPVTDYRKAGEAGAVIICVPTPLTPYHTPDLSFLQDAAQAVGEQLTQGQTVILESSTYPGTTREVLKPILEKTSGLRAGKDFYVGYSPERIDPGNQDFTVERIPKLVSGLTVACGDKVEELYSRVFERVVRVSTTEVAEMAKIVENSQRLVNITFMNELALICDEMHIDVWEVIDAAATKPFGFTAYYPGPGIGGHCIPVDPLYLQWKSRSYNMESEFIGLSERLNRSMPRVIADKVFALLMLARKGGSEGAEGGVQVEDKQGVVEELVEKNEKKTGVETADGLKSRADGGANEVAVRVAKERAPLILLYGVAYKKDVNDVRESPALDLIPILSEKGARIEYHDPYIEEIRVGGQTYQSVELTAEKLQEADCVVVLTDHTGMPMERIVQHASLIFDTRNAFSAFKQDPRVYIFGGGVRNQRSHEQDH